MSSREEFAGVTPTGQFVMSGATTGLEMLVQALANLPVMESTREGGPPARIDPTFCKLYGPPPQGDTEYYQGQWSGLKPDTHPNS